MISYIARQPIFDRAKALLGYELLFRDGNTNAFPNIDSNEATQRLVENSELNAGISRITSDKTAFINFTEEAICSGLPQLLPKQTTVIELLETVTPSDCVYESLKQLKAKGYTVALDDFEFSAGWQRFMPLVDIIKMDFRLMSLEQIKRDMASHQGFKGVYLAEKIENYDEFKQAVEMGFNYFQGYFFARPEVIERRTLSASKKVYTELLDKVSGDSYDPEAIADIVERDPGISFKLLRFVNSAFFARQTEITSLRQAVVRLGQEEVRKFLAIIATASLAEDKPEELTRLAITRAKFFEQLAMSNERYGADPDTAFLAGLLSNLDAMMDDELGNLLFTIHASLGIRLALMENKGPIAFFLKTMIAIEQGNWKAIKLAATKLKLTEKQLMNQYYNALHWVDSVYS